MKSFRPPRLVVLLLWALLVLPGLAAARGPAADQPVAGQPAAGQPAAGQPVAASPAHGEPVIAAEEAGAVAAGVDRAAGSSEAAEAAKTVAAAAEASASPLMRDIRTLWMARQAEVAVLEESFRAASDHPTALAIQKRIEALLVQTEFDILQLQADHARREGRAADAERIEAEIAAAKTLPAQQTVDPQKRSPRAGGEPAAR